MNNTIEDLIAHLQEESIRLKFEQVNFIHEKSFRHWH